MTESKVNYRYLGIIAYVVAAVVLSCHLQSLWNKFVYMDKFNLWPLIAILDWPKFWLETLTQCLTSPLSEPLFRATLALDVQGVRMRYPSVYHAINLALHLGNSLLWGGLVYRVARYQLKTWKNSVSFNPYLLTVVATCLFASHPISSETVSYISARSTLLVTFYYLASLHCFMLGFLTKEITPGLLGYGFGYFFVILATWSSAQGITAPCAFLALTILMKPQKETYKNWLVSRPYEFFAQLFLALVVPFVLLVKYVAPIGNGFGLEKLDPISYLLSQGQMLVTYYLRVFFIPYGFTLDPPQLSVPLLNQALSVIGILIPIALLYLAYRMRTTLVVSFPLALLVISLLPNFVMVQPEIVSDRRFYIASACLCTVVAYFLSVKFDEKPKILVSISSALVLLFCGLTNWRTYYWYDDQRLWSETYRLNPSSKRSQVMDIWAQAFQGNLDKGAERAEKLLKEQGEAKEYRAILDLVLGTHRLKRKKFEEAKQYFSEGLDLADKQNLSTEIIWEMQSGLAEAAIATDDFATARKYANEAVKVQPNKSNLHLILGRCFLAEFNPNAAFIELQQAHLLDRYNADVLEPLARACIGIGTTKMQDLGYKIATQARQVFGTSDALLLTTAYASLESGHLEEALGYLETYAAAKNRKTSDYYYLFYGLYKRLNWEAQAKEALELAVRMDPDVRKRTKLFLNHPIVPLKKMPSTQVK